MLLRDCVVTSTGLSKADREKLRTKVEGIGGSFSHQLNTNNTHLVTEKTDTEKYRVAVKLHLVVVKPSWVSACWEYAQNHREDGPVAQRAALERLEREHRLHAFKGLKICVTGLEVDERNRIEALTHQHGGEYSKDLTKHCTHLVGVQSSGSKKIDFALRWGMKVVTTSWFFDSVQNGGRMDESLYPLTEETTSKTGIVPPGAPGNANTSANEKTHVTATEISDGSATLVPNTNLLSREKRGSSTTEMGSIGHQGVVVDGSCADVLVEDPAREKEAETAIRELMRTTKHSKVEVLKGCNVFLCGVAEGTPRHSGLRALIANAGAMRFTAINDSITHVVVAGRAFAGEQGNLQMAVARHKHNPERLKVVGIDWLVDSCLQHARQPEEPYALSLTLDGSVVVVALAPTHHTLSAAAEAGIQLFTGMVFAVAGFEKVIRRELQKAITAHGGTVISSGDVSGPTPTHCVLPLDGHHHIKRLPPELHTCTLVSDLWLEKCINGQSVVDPSSASFYRPLDCTLPLAGSADVAVCATHYPPEDRLLIEQLIGYLGGTYVEAMTQGATTHLICMQAAGSKYSAAKGWGIPCVPIAWLEACAREGIFVETESFEIGSNQSETTTGKTSHPTAQPPSAPQTNGSTGKFGRNSFCTPVRGGPNAKQPVAGPQARTKHSNNSVNEHSENGQRGNDTSLENDETLDFENQITGTEGGDYVANEGQSMNEADDHDHGNGGGLNLGDAIQDFEIACENGKGNSDMSMLGAQLNLQLRSAVDNVTGKRQPKNSAAAPSPRRTPRRTPASTKREKPTPSPKKTPLEDAKLATAGKTPEGVGGAVGWQGSGGEVIGAGFAGQHTRPSIKKRRMWYDDEAYTAQDRGTILAGTCIYVSRLLQEEQKAAEWYHLAKRMGASCVWTYSADTVTHLVHHEYLDEGQTPRRKRTGGRHDTREVREALKDGKSVVSGAWLRQCYLDRKRVEEEKFPHTLPVSGEPIVPSAATHPAPTDTQPRKSGQNEETNGYDETTLDPETESGNETMQSTSKKQKPETKTPGKESLNETPGATATRKGTANESGNIQESGEVGGGGDGVGAVRGSMSEGEGEEEGGKEAEVAEMMSMLMSALPQPGNRPRLAARRKLRTTEGGDKAGGSHGGTPEKRMMGGSIEPTQGQQQQPPGDDQQDLVTYGESRGRLQRQQIMAHLLRPRLSNSGSSDSTQPTPTQTPGPVPGPGATQVPIQSTIPTSAIPIPTKQIDVIEIPDDEAERGKTKGPESNGVDKRPTKKIGNLERETRKNESAGGAGTGFKEPQPKHAQEKDSSNAQKYRFLLSAMQQSDRQSLTTAIERLGGSVNNTMYFDPQCTHVIIKYPSGSEKFLAACAAGKWILKEAFVRDSAKAGRFVAEEPYVWTKDDITSDEANGDKGNMVSAASRWHRHVCEQKKEGGLCGAYVGWKVLIHLKAKQDCYQRLLEAGGATIISKRTPFSLAEIKSSTHAFLDSLGSEKENGITSSDIEALQRHKVQCLQPQYISSYLLDFPHPDTARFTLLLQTPTTTRHRSVRGEDDGPLDREVGGGGVKRKLTESAEGPAAGTRRRARFP